VVLEHLPREPATPAAQGGDRLTLPAPGCLYRLFRDDLGHGLALELIDAAPSWFTAQTEMLFEFVLSRQPGSLVT